MLSSLILIISVTLSCLLCLLAYIGAFRRIEFEDGIIDSCIFVFRKGAGKYKDLGSVFNFISDSTKKYGLQDCKIAGIYYDDPAKTNMPRYAVGFLIEKDHIPRFEGLKDILKKDFQMLDLKRTKTIVAHFPIRAGSLSYALSAIKVYPAFKKRVHFRIQSGAVEIYHGQKVIATHFPLENLDQFRPQ